ncbi:acyl-CoA-binding domain-containing protein 4 [Tanacetum coccineum]
MGSDKSNWHSDLEYDKWVTLPVTGPRPSARYKHAAVVIGEKLYIVGGSRNGRYLSDGLAEFIHVMMANNHNNHNNQDIVEVIRVFAINNDATITKAKREDNLKN